MLLIGLSSLFSLQNSLIARGAQALSNVRLNLAALLSRVDSLRSLSFLLRLDRCRSIILLLCILGLSLLVRASFSSAIRFGLFGILGSRGSCRLDWTGDGLSVGLGLLSSLCLFCILFFLESLGRDFFG